MFAFKGTNGVLGRLRSVASCAKAQRKAEKVGAAEIERALRRDRGDQAGVTPPPARDFGL